MNDFGAPLPGPTFSQISFINQRNFNDFGISELIGNPNDSNTLSLSLFVFERDLNRKRLLEGARCIDLIMKSDASGALGALSSEMLPRASI